MSIGSNDLTQITLEIDRVSELLAKEFNEMDPEVLKMVAMSIEGTKRNGKHSGLCGQAPSDYPEFAEFLVRVGIDSISINPDTAMKTTLRVLDVEKEMGIATSSRSMAPAGGMASSKGATSDRKGSFSRGSSSERGQGRWSSNIIEPK